MTKAEFYKTVELIAAEDIGAEADLLSCAADVETYDAQLAATMRNAYKAAAAMQARAKVLLAE